MAKQIPFLLPCGCFGASKPKQRTWKAQARSNTLTYKMLEHVIEAAAAHIECWNPDEFTTVCSLQEPNQSRASVDFVKHQSKSLAVKRMPNRWIKSRASEFDESNPKSSEKPWIEIGLLRYLNALGFPHVCDLFGIFRDEEYTYVATSLASEGDLFHWVEQLSLAPGLDRERMIRPMMGQLFSAVQKLHDLGIAHRDISLENTLLTTNSEGGIQLQLIDFGMATLSRGCTEVRGKKAYQAPEMHSDPDYDSFLADDFALGVVLYAMALSDYPWVATRLGGCKLFEFIHTWGFMEFIKKRSCKKGTSPRIIEVLSPELAELLDGLLELHPEDRLCLGESCYEDKTHWSAWNMAWLSGSPRKSRPNCVIS